MNLAILKRYRFPFKPAYWDILALSAWGILFLYYRLTNQLRLLIHPRYYWAVVLAGMVLLGLAIAKTFVTVTNTAPTSGGQHIKTLPGNLSSNMQEGYTVVGLPTRPQVQRFTSGARPEDRTLSDWARTLAVYPEPDSYAGKTVNVSGFVVHPPELPDNIFMVTRFVIRHCPLDATPVGFP